MRDTLEANFVETTRWSWPSPSGNHRWAEGTEGRERDGAGREEPQFQKGQVPTRVAASAFGRHPNRRDMFSDVS
jgi:hypothetical protein